MICSVLVSYLRFSVSMRERLVIDLGSNKNLKPPGHGLNRRNYPTILNLLLESFIFNSGDFAIDLSSLGGREGRYLH